MPLSCGISMLMTLSTSDDFACSAGAPVVVKFVRHSIRRIAATKIAVAFGLTGEKLRLVAIDAAWGSVHALRAACSMQDATSRMQQAGCNMQRNVAT